MFGFATKFEKLFDSIEDEESTFPNECQPIRDDWEDDEPTLVIEDSLLKMIGRMQVYLDWLKKKKF